MKDQELILNQSENTEYTWLSVDEALDLYCSDQLPMIPPQVLILLHLKHKATTYDQLKVLAQCQQVNPLSYLTQRNITYRMG